MKNNFLTIIVVISLFLSSAFLFIYGQNKITDEGSEGFFIVAFENNTNIIVPSEKNLQALVFFVENNGNEKIEYTVNYMLNQDSSLEEMKIQIDANSKITIKPTQTVINQLETLPLGESAKFTVRVAGKSRGKEIHKTVTIN